MIKPFISGALKATVAVVMIAGTAAVALADADSGRPGKPVVLSPRPKTIVIDNLDTSVFNKGNPTTATMAQEVCGDCHSIDYATTQPKLSCAVWAKEIVKMGNTFDAKLPWVEDGVSYTMLNTVLVYLADNYGAGSSGCSQSDYNAIKTIPGLSN